ncbi:hypothetical protein Glove_166g203 [Diversispora epigaea]|uniref:Plastocyanin-like domain-containing protein n=1 Tax=Diversispora epigaea TaxID=1348612 RepID=A0A397IQP2_9GLOM|nr:hypothetical protein Glove_166g203 [Diversispora epigaea]
MIPTPTVPDNGLINGKNNFDCSKAPPGSKCVDNTGLAKFEFVQNKKYRLRIINTSAFSAFFFSIDKHEMEVIEADGSYTKRNKIHRLPINVAQRYSVIVTANQPADNYIMRSEFQKNCMPAAAASLPIMKAIVHYEGTPDDLEPKDNPWSDSLTECVDLDHKTLQPLEEEKIPEPTKKLELKIAFHKNATGVVKAFLNESSYIPDINFPTLDKIFKGKSFNEPSANAYVFDKAGEVVDIYFINTSIGEHPFHIHGFQFWVLGTGNGTKVDEDDLNTHNPIKRDTATIPALGWIAIRFISDNPGWHLESGLLMQLITLPDEILKMHPPKEWTKLCELDNKEYKRQTAELEKKYMGNLSNQPFITIAKDLLYSICKSSHSQNNKRKTIGKFTDIPSQYINLLNPHKYEHMYDPENSFVIINNKNKGSIVGVFDYTELYAYLEMHHPTLLAL